VTRDEVDWRQIAEVATGILGWPPDTFWAATPAEFWTAWDGWRARHAGDEMDAPSPLTRADLAGLMAAFPDGPG
jgi:hypothetical protein